MNEDLRKLAAMLAEDSSYLPSIGTKENLQKPRASKKAYKEFVQKYGHAMDAATNEFGVEAGYSQMDPIAKLGFDPTVITMLMDESGLAGSYNQAGSTLNQLAGLADSIEINNKLATKTSKGEVSDATRGTIAHEARHRGFDRILNGEEVDIHQLSEEIVNRVYDYVYQNSSFGDQVLKSSGRKMTPSFMKDIKAKKDSPDKFEAKDEGEYSFHKYRELEERAKKLMNLLYYQWDKVR